MREVQVRKGEPVDRALKRLKTKLEMEGILEEMRRLRSHENKTERLRRKARAAKPSGRTGLARVSGSLEQRHQVCLAFIRRHNLDCDPWQTPTCGAETGYFRPPECVRPRSQQ